MSKKGQKALASATIMSLVLTTALTTIPAMADTTVGTAISGTGRVETSIAIADKAYANWTTSTTAVIASGANASMVDALAVAPLAYAQKAPIYLTSGGAIDASVITSLKNHKVTTVYLVGAAKSDENIAALKAAGITTVTPLAGTDRFATAQAINTELEKLGAPKGYVVVNGKSMADALSVAAIAAKQDYEIVLAKDANTTPTVPTGKTVYAIGGTGVISDTVKTALGATRLGGATRFATNAEVLKGLDASLDYTTTYVADGTDAHMVDALPGSVLAGQTSSPIVLVNSAAGVDSSVNTVLTGKAGKVTTVTALGGAVTTAITDAIKTATTPVVTDLKVDSVSAINLKQVEVKFNQDMDQDSAEDVSNYSLTGISNVSGLTKIVKASLNSDKRTVTLTFDGNLNNQTGKVTLTVSKYVESADATELGTNTIFKNLSYTDTTLPSVDSVTAVGNKKLIIKFSEPIKGNYGSPSSYKIDDNYISMSSISLDSVTGRTLTINLVNALKAGDHNFKTVANAVTDYALLNNAEDTDSFNVADVKVAPTASVVSATPTTVKVKFDRELTAKPTIKFGSTTCTVTQDTDDPTLYIVTGMTIPNAGGQLTIVKGISDYYGNKTTDNIVLDVVPNIDAVRPVLNSAISEVEGQIVLKFSEDVASPSYGTYTVKDKDGNAVSVSALYNTSSSGKTVKSEIVLKGSLKPTASPYKVSVKGVKDLAGNVMNAVVDQEVTIPDKTAPSIASVTKNVDANKLAVTFSEKVDPATINTLDAYKYEINGKGIYALPAGTTVTANTDGKSVTLQLPENWDINSATYTISSISSLYFTGIKDLAGNTMADTNYNVPASNEAIATVTSIVATDVNTIKVNLSDTGALPSTAYAGDFKVTKGSTTYSVSDVSIDTSNRRLVLTLADDLPAAIASGDVKVTLGTTTTLGTKTALGTDFIFGATNVTDKIAPSVDTDNADITEKGSNVSITLPFTEDIKAGLTSDAGTALQNALLVKIGDTVLVPTTDFTVVETNGIATLVLKTDSATLKTEDLTSAIKVSMPESPATLTITDAAGNPVSAMGEVTFNIDFTEANPATLVPINATAGTDYKVVDGVCYITKAYVEAKKVTNASLGNAYFEMKLQDNSTDLSLASAVAGDYSYNSLDGNTWTTLDNNTDATLWANAGAAGIRYFAFQNNGKLYMVEYEIVDTLPQ